MEEHIDQIALKKKDAIDIKKWRDGIYKTFKKHEVNPATCVNADKTRFIKVDLSFSLSGSTTSFD